MLQEKVSARMDMLEKRSRYQKRVLVGLVVAFLFTSAPALTSGVSWMQNFKEFGKHFASREGSFIAETEVQALSKRAHAAGDVLTVSQVQIVNEEGTTVGVIGYDTVGHGGVWVFNRKGKEIGKLGSDSAGHGRLNIRNASERGIAAVGAAPSSTVGASASGEGGIVSVWGGVVQSKFFC